jgi:LmbE family N-acetylglucosaminyl deacetylase
VNTYLPVPQRALAIGAHPDDVDFWCGATLAKWTDAGCVVSYLVCTDGALGTWDPAADLAELVAQRQAEQRAAAKALGTTGEVVFLGWPDGELSSGLEPRRRIAFWIRRLRPDVVLGHDPWRRYRLHPDHRHAGFLTLDAIVTAREPHAIPEQELLAHRPEAVLLFEAEEPDHVEVVDETHVARKLGALEAHRSQYRSTMGIIDHDGPERDAQIEAFRDQVRDRLSEHGILGGSRWGEAFKLMTDL